MWQYNSLYHSGSSEPDFKYVAKVTKNGKTRYFYDQKEYQRYLHPKKKNPFSKFMKSLTVPISDFIESSRDKIAKAAAFISTVSHNTVDNIVGVLSDDDEKPDNKKAVIPKTSTVEELSKSNKYKYTNKVELPNGTFRYFYNEDEYARYLKKVEYQKTDPDFMKTVMETKDLLDPSVDVLDRSMQMSEINEKYDEGISYQMNCMNCTAAYELRCRGYDVEAGPNPSGYDLVDISNWYVDPKIIDLPPGKGVTAKGFADSIVENSGPNSRGNIMVVWEEGGGHSMAYEVDADNKLTIIDNQVNSIADLDKLVDMKSPTSWMCRTDNLELKEGVLDIINVN